MQANRVSYNLAVWEGDRPKNRKAAQAEFAALIEKYQNVKRSPKPTPAIRRYVEALVAKWPDTGEDYENGPWADAPLINNATGPIFYFAMRFSQCEEASRFAAKLAAKHKLVCFDPQSGKLR